MQYQTVKKAVFLSRPNRFIARVELEGAEETVHVKNTGRCRELLRPGAAVWLEAGSNPARKTRFDLIAVEKERPGLIRGLKKLGCAVVPGQANYLLFRLPGVADLKERLLQAGVLIRSCANYHGLGTDWYRVCVRTGEENRRLLAAMEEAV